MFLRGGFVLADFFNHFHSVLDSLVEGFGDESYNQDHTHDYGKGDDQEEP